MDGQLQGPETLKSRVRCVVIKMSFFSFFVSPERMSLSFHWILRGISSSQRACKALQRGCELKSEELLRLSDQLCHQDFMGGRAKQLTQPSRTMPSFNKEGNCVSKPQVQRQASPWVSSLSFGSSRPNTTWDDQALLALILCEGAAGGRRPLISSESLWTL